MSVTYRAIGWNRQKRGYDAIAAAGVAGYLALFAGGMAVLHPQATIETVLIRGFGTLALLLLHVVLSIGPLCRLDARLLPLLYNRRHLGVTMFLAAAIHGGLSIFQFHALGDAHPVVSLLATSRDWTTASGFPFQMFGAAALVILFAMAASSHDFWLHTLGPQTWKALHMLVYAAYALLIVHVAFGALQSERSVVLIATLGAGMTWIVALHLAAAIREKRIDAAPRETLALIDVAAVGDIPDSRARVVSAGGERIAVFRHGDAVSAISNVCRHQNGPLGEGRIVRGCVVCPWHGYEYLPESGASPPPFTEKVATFRVVIRDGRVLLDPRPHPPGTWLEPARLTTTSPAGGRS